MSFLASVKNYVSKIGSMIRDYGVGWTFRYPYQRLKDKFRRAPGTVTVQDWLDYYQRRREIRYTPVDKLDFARYPKVSILILTYNNLLINQLCLISLYCNTTYPNFEVVVVDNASSDETPSWLRTFARKHPNLKVILNSENKGFAGGNNQAAKEASGEYLIFLNNDTVVTRGWVERLLKYIRRDPKIGLVGPVTNSTGNEARVQVSYITPGEMEAFAERRANEMAGISFDIRMLAFYCVLAQKAQFESIGGLDERFQVGMFEDDDLAVRYHQQGLRVVCAEDVFIHHFQGASFGKLDNDRYQKIFEENKGKYETKWGRAWEPYQWRQTSDPYSSDIALTDPQRSWGNLTYRCNICGCTCETLMADLTREKRTCQCGSTVRSRSIVHLLSKELFGRSLALPDFPIRLDLNGWGMSDAFYAQLLPQKVNFINTFYDREPRFDITEPLDPKVEGTLDFLISTEVFEHVAPPVSRAFENARRLLKSTGVLILTVPYNLEANTREHFPELYQYEIDRTEGQDPVLRNITKEGIEQTFNNLVFHGRVGATLEMRVFSQNGLLMELSQAGFETVKICSEPCWEFGIYWNRPWSLPIIARPSRVY